MGVPVVFPSKMPDKNFTSSSSFLWVTMEDCPGLRRFISAAMALKSNFIPAGHPSSIPPMASPCDSPKVVSLKILPKELPAIKWFLTNVNFQRQLFKNDLGKRECRFFCNHRSRIKKSQLTNKEKNLPKLQ